MNKEMDMPEPPDGYEYTGEYKPLLKGELGFGGEFDDIYEGPTLCCWPVVKKKPKAFWRAYGGEKYYIVTPDGNIRTMREDGFMADDAYHAFGNYFSSKEQARAAAEKVKRAFIKFHKSH